MSFSDDTKPKLTPDVKPLPAFDSEQKPDLKLPRDYFDEKPFRVGDTKDFVKDEKAFVLSPDKKLSLKQDEKKFRLSHLTDVKIKKEKNDTDHSISFDVDSPMNVGAEMDQEIPPEHDVPIHDATVPLVEQTLDLSLHQTPTTRKRVFMDAVVVPTMALLRSQRGQKPLIRVKMEPRDIVVKLEPVGEEDKIKIEAFDNPDVKVKKGKGLSQESIHYRLHAVGLDPFIIRLDNVTLNATVTRFWMSYTYGGGPVETYPKIDRAKFTHGMNDFCYLNYDFNPDAPKNPGFPGLVYEVGNPEEEKNVRLVMRRDNNKWQYLGQYARIPAVSLTTQEWLSQPSTFQNSWSRDISTHSWGRIVRARIHLRKQLGREPTTIELEDGNDYKNVTPDMIKQAFVDGDEEIYVYCVKCIGYDVDFQRNLATMPIGWEHPKVIARREGIKNGTVKGKSSKRKAPPVEDLDHPDTSTKVAKSPSKRNAKKRKEIEVNDRGEDDSAMVISDNDNDSSETKGTNKKPKKAYVPKGTRSRPIRL